MLDLNFGDESLESLSWEHSSVIIKHCTY